MTKGAPDLAARAAPIAAAEREQLRPPKEISLAVPAVHNVPQSSINGTGRAGCPAAHG